MTSSRSSQEDYSARAAGSAGCLLVIGGYRDNADFLGAVKDATEQQFLSSPTLSDFYDLRFVDLGQRPAKSHGGSVEVAALTLGLTSRPGDVARNFSAIIIFDRSAARVASVLKDCEADPMLSDLRVRLYGLASVDDRPHGTSPGGTGPEIALAPKGGRTVPEFASEITAYAEDLLAHFGSGAETGLPAEQLDAIGAKAHSELRGVVAAAIRADADAELSARKREAERRREAELQEAAAHRAAEAKQAAEAAALAREAKADPIVYETVTFPDAGALDPEPPVARPAVESSPSLPNRAGVRDSAAGFISRVRGLTAPREPRLYDSDTGAKLLLDSAECLRAGDERGLSAYLGTLRNYAEAGLSAEQREHYLAIIRYSRLFSTGLPEVPLAELFCDTMLGLLYEKPVSYQAFCEIEDLAEAERPDQRLPRPLLEVIIREEPVEIRVAALAYFQLGAERLSQWLRSGQVDVRQLISALAGRWDRWTHADILYYVALRYFGELGAEYNRQAVVAALRENDYLAVALRERYPQSIRNQVGVLREFLLAAYPAGLDRRAIAEVFTSGEPTAGLAVAVLSDLADPVDSTWAIEVFGHQLERSGAAPEKKSELLRLLRSTVSKFALPPPEPADQDQRRRK